MLWDAPRSARGKGGLLGRVRDAGSIPGTRCTPIPADYLGSGHAFFQGIESESLSVARDSYDAS